MKTTSNTPQTDAYRIRFTAKGIQMMSGHDAQREIEAAKRASKRQREKRVPIKVLARA